MQSNKLVSEAKAGLIDDRTELIQISNKELTRWSYLYDCQDVVGNVL